MSYYLGHKEEGVEFQGLTGTPIQHPPFLLSCRVGQASNICIQISFGDTNLVLDEIELKRKSEVSPITNNNQCFVLDYKSGIANS